MAQDEGSSFQGTISIAQTLLRKEMEKGEPITPALIAEKVALSAALVDAAGGVDKAAAVAELIRRFSHWIGQDSTMADNEGHLPWLVAGRKRDWRYWLRYQGMLEGRMSAAAVDALDKSTDEILGLLEDPLREGSW